MAPGCDVCGNNVPGAARQTQFDHAVFQSIDFRDRTQIGHLNPSDLGILHHGRPHNMYYVTEESRLKSFEGWPPGLNQKPEQLAKAGFYYQGHGDEVKCFSCDGGLSSWEPQDTPEGEHRKWFPYCTFLNISLPLEPVINNDNPPRNPPGSSAVGEEDISQQQQQQQKQKQLPLRRVRTASASMSAEMIGPKEEKLKEEIQQLKDGRSCKICLQEEASVVFLPCGHLSSCTNCASALQACPVCRAAILGLVRAFVA